MPGKQLAGPVIRCGEYRPRVFQHCAARTGCSKESAVLRRRSKARRFVRIRYGEFLARCTLVATVLAIAACTTTSETIREAQLGGDRAQFTNASQRAVISTQQEPFSRPGLVDPTSIVCTEPSPDVGITLAQSIGANLSVFAKGSAAFQSSLTEGLTQLGERTAAIQLLRDKMYQSCLAYRNGAISGTTYTLIMTKLDDTIVTMLLGESAAGAFGRSGGALGGDASGSSSGAVAARGASADFDEDLKKLNEAQKEQEDANKRYNDAVTNCTDIEEAKKTDDENCKSLEKLKSDRDIAQGKVNEARARFQGSAVSFASAAARSTATAMGGLQRTPDAAIASRLEEIQDNFLTSDISTTFIPTCLVELGLHQDDRSSGERLLAFLRGEVDRLSGEIELQADKRRELASKRAANIGLTADEAEEEKALPQRIDRLVAAHDEAQRKVDDVLATRSTSLAESPYYKGLAGLYRTLESDWEAGKRNVSLRDVTAALTSQGRSLLVEVCLNQLPFQLSQLGKNAQTFRKARLESRERVETAEWAARTAEAQNSLLKQFESTLKYCDSLTDEKERKPCRDRVYALSGQRSE